MTPLSIDHDAGGVRPRKGASMSAAAHLAWRKMRCWLAASCGGRQRHSESPTVVGAPELGAIRPNGAATGLLVKDYRGKDANQEVWKFDAAIEAKLMEALKQAAIEEG
jgi:hypothetical protein